MSMKKWITKKEISDVLKSYSVRTNEFEQVGNDGYFFKSKCVKGYTISIQPEIQGNIGLKCTPISGHTKSSQCVYAV